MKKIIQVIGVILYLQGAFVGASDWYPWNWGNQKTTINDFKKYIINDIKIYLEARLFNVASKMYDAGLSQYSLEDNTWYTREGIVVPFDELSKKDQKIVSAFRILESEKESMKDENTFLMRMMSINQKPLRQRSEHENLMSKYYSAALGSLQLKYLLSVEQLQQLEQSIASSQPKKEYVTLPSILEAELTPVQRLQQVFQEGYEWAKKQWQQSRAKSYFDFESRKMTDPSAERAFERLEGLSPMRKNYVFPRIQQVRERAAASPILVPEQRSKEARQSFKRLQLGGGYE